MDLPIGELDDARAGEPMSEPGASIHAPEAAEEEEEVTHGV